MSKLKEYRRLTIWRRKPGSVDSYERQFNDSFTAAECELARRMVGALTGLYLDALREPRTWNGGTPIAKVVGDRLIVVEYA